MHSKAEKIFNFGLIHFNIFSNFLNSSRTELKPQPWPRFIYLRPSGELHSCVQLREYIVKLIEKQPIQKLDRKLNYCYN